MNRIIKIILLAAISLTIITSSKYIVTVRVNQVLRNIISNNLEIGALVRAQLESVRNKLSKLSGTNDGTADNLGILQSRMEKSNFEVKSLCTIMQKAKESNCLLKQEIADLKSSKIEPQELSSKTGIKDKDVDSKDGNGGYITKDGNATFKSNVRIEVRSTSQNDY